MSLANRAKEDSKWLMLQSWKLDKLLRLKWRRFALLSG
ncbi:hypothetical protein Rleg4DRAFT_2461 [Rhizobium leguminosarum bv. trifolii WSM2297]|uniref:Uncharacterized protein n=1 Tax=Rhizobium leguminosarum bv. trifolii WSM2297 TaxID=754762 RepID=J0CML8_RHILT|nr:hypothetical protein Rleg4DRAFT_2461 [Rhizobium leguminosarum bv. trifolii WSM2297]